MGRWAKNPLVEIFMASDALHAIGSGNPTGVDVTFHVKPLQGCYPPELHSEASSNKVANRQPAV
jgi:phenolic acid decarboxylase